MKVLRLLRHNKFSAATARRSAASAGMDFEEMPEPNMKLSRALLIVLLLHVVAVSGIIAFNAIKTRESSFVPAASTSANTQAKPANVPRASTHTDGTRPQTPAAQKENAAREDIKPSSSPSKSSSKDDHANVSSQAKAATNKPVSSGKTYIVKKGDNPVTIAKKLKVPYDDLMALNHIEDARKLRIGQKLLIPRTTPKATKGKASNSREKKDEARTQSNKRTRRDHAS
jgi:LysM repeat protein